MASLARLWAESLTISTSCPLARLRDRSLGVRMMPHGPGNRPEACGGRRAGRARARQRPVQVVLVDRADPGGERPVGDRHALRGVHPQGAHPASQGPPGRMTVAESIDSFESPRSRAPEPIDWAL